MTIRRFALLSLPLVAVVLLLSWAQLAEAQTATPTDPYPIELFAPLQSPTPISALPTVDLNFPIAEEHSYIYNGLATVEAGLAQAPADLTNPGLPILPGTQGGELFGYIKWIFSTNIAYEVFGRFGEIMVHLAARMTLIIFMTSIGLLIVLTTFVFKVIVWVVTKIRAMLPL